MRTRQAAALFCLLASATLSAACDDGISQSSSDLSDSFASPTNHGDLIFGAPNRGSFSASERFHAWNFALSGPADLDLATADLATNLDTKIYLYRRDPGTTAWGRSIASNDDDKGQLSSRLGGSFEAGEYLLKVKAAKTAMRGGFSVLGACTGAGCPDDGATCDPETAAGAPDETGYGSACGPAATAVLLAPVTSDVTETVGATAKCDAGTMGAHAIDLYEDYWNGIIGWEEFLGEDPAEASLNVRTVRHGDAGTTVEVDAGGDEDLLAFVFDASGELVLAFHSEQSPVAMWYCADAADPQAEDPPEDCAGAVLWALRHVPSAAVDDEGTTTAARAAADLDWMAPAVTRFATLVGLSNAAPINYERSVWTSIDAGEAGELLLDAGGASARYLISEDEILLEQNGDGPLDFVCLDN